jgi:hypothetical protein
VYKIRIYTKAGHQIELWVKEFVLKPGEKWTAEWAPNQPRILSLSPSQIEAVLVLEERELDSDIPTDLGQQTY